MARRNVKADIDALLAKRESIATAELASALGVTRQAAQRYLRRGVEEGWLVAEGRGRGARYRPSVPRFVYPIAGSAEDRILDDVARRVPAFGALTGDEASAARYVFTVLVNNALDHSGGETVAVTVDLSPDRLAITVDDDGIGAFERVRSERALASHVEAAAELTKGKTTTMPERHSGEGIFFSSKVADRFELLANGHVLLIDNGRDDVAVLASERATGTRAVAIFHRPIRKRLVDVFAEYTDDHEFSRTRTVVRLFGIGLDFVSRSEARRLMHGLDRFREVVLDFDRVPGIGQGFADEIFRVFARAHPDVKLVPERMNDDVRFFVERARRAAR